MPINPSNFHPINVADTCSVWNVLSSTLLYRIAHDARCNFCITNFVNYECLLKPRKSAKLSKAEAALKSRLLSAQTKGHFLPQSCDIADLQNIKILESRKRLGLGELSSIALAIKYGQAFITDDRKAKKLSEDSGNKLTQTTPHLFAWLYFTSRLGDSDVATVISQHNESERPLEPHFNKAYQIALECKLNTLRPKTV